MFVRPVPKLKRHRMKIPIRSGTKITRSIQKRSYSFWSISNKLKISSYSSEITDVMKFSKVSKFQK